MPATPFGRTRRSARAADRRRRAARGGARRGPGSAERPLAVVVAHGFTAVDRAARGAGRSSRRSRAYAGVVAFDFRGHGRSSGQSTVGDREVLDLEAAVGAARRLGLRRRRHLRLVDGRQRRAAARRAARRRRRGHQRLGAVALVLQGHGADAAGALGDRDPAGPARRARGLFGTRISAASAGTRRAAGVAGRGGRADQPDPGAVRARRPRTTTSRSSTRRRCTPRPASRRSCGWSRGSATPRAPPAPELLDRIGAHLAALVARGRGPGPGGQGRSGYGDRNASLLGGRAGGGRGRRGAVRRHHPRRRDRRGEGLARRARWRGCSTGARSWSMMHTSAAAA